jgi:hypothetical protein
MNNAERVGRITALEGYSYQIWKYQASFSGCQHLTGRHGHRGVGKAPGGRHVQEHCLVL